jgi:hypothetical protein
MWLLLAAGAHPCQVPVFRYALDRWEPDRYRLEVPPAAAAAAQIAPFLRNLGTSSPLNLDARPNAQATGAALFFPGSGTALWRGELTAATAGLLGDSPARKELAGRLLRGDSAVWVLVESTPKADGVAALVEQRLQLLERVAQLPRIDSNDPDSQLGPGPALKLHFSLLRVDSDDPAEGALVRMLAGPSATGAAPFPSLPALALVFGRGRVLRAGPAEEFDEREIEEASLFLTRACSCRVKRENPGWDLLMAVKWDEALAAAATSVPAAASSSPAAPEIVKIEGAPATPAVSEPKANPPRQGSAVRATVFGICAVAVAALLTMVSRKIFSA